MKEKWRHYVVTVILAIFGMLFALACVHLYFDHNFLNSIRIVSQPGPGPQKPPQP